MGSLALGVGIAAAATVTPRTPSTTSAPTTAPTTPVSPIIVTPTTATATITPTPTTAPAISNPFQPPATAATSHVSIVDFGYSPASITVTAGSTVTWTNTGTVIHSVTADGGGFDSSPSCPTGPCIDPGSSFSHTFATAGTFTYHCRVHSNMHGTVIVKAVAAPTTTQPGSPVTAGGNAAPTTVAATSSGPQLAFTGVAADEAWIALGALFTVALGLALRPRRRPFPVPVTPTDPTSRR